MKKFKVIGIEKSFYYDIVEAKDKKEAEEIFRENYEDGNLTRDEEEFEFEVDEVKELTEEELKEIKKSNKEYEEQELKELPIEFEDSVENAQEYLDKGYRMLMGVDGTTSCIYSKKKEKLEEYIETFEGLRVEEWIKEHYPNIMVRGLGQEEKTRNVVINYILTKKVRDYCFSLNCKINNNENLDFRDKVSLTVSKMVDVINKTVELDKQKIDEIIKECKEKYKGEKRITNPMVKTVLESKNINLPKPQLEDLGRWIRSKL